MKVEAGALTFFPGSFLRLDASGPWGWTGDSLQAIGSFTVQGPYTGVAPDSLRTTIGITGRVWGDSAELRGAFPPWSGNHTSLYVRVEGR